MGVIMGFFILIGIIGLFVSSIVLIITLVSNGEVKPIIGVMLIFAFIIFVGSSACTPTEQSTTNQDTQTNKQQTVIVNGETIVIDSDSAKITLSEFNKIQNGMSYDEVIKIIGGSGILSSEYGTPGEMLYSQTYTFDGKGDFGSIATLIFKEGTLQMKTQNGLK